MLVTMAAGCGMDGGILTAGLRALRMGVVIGGLAVY